MADQKLHAILGVSPRKSLLDQPETDEDLDYQAFSFGRVGTRAAAMICFIKADRYHLVLPYSDIRSISTPDPETGFEADFGHYKITIVGRNLAPAFCYFKDNRLIELAEATRANVMSLANSEVIVDKMLILNR